MAQDSDGGGCGCLLVAVFVISGLIVLLGGGTVVQAFAAAIGSAIVAWFAFFAFIAVTVGMMLLIIKLIAGR